MLEDDWDDSDDGGEEDGTGGLEGGAAAAPFGDRFDIGGAAGTIALRDWIESRRSGGDDAPSTREHLEDVVQIMRSLVGKITAGGAGKARSGTVEIMGSADVDDETIAVHPNFITISNIIVERESTKWVTPRLEGGISADFVQCGDSIFCSDISVDEAKKKYDAMDALGRIAYEMCMRGNGPSVAEFFTTEETGANSNTKSENILSTAIDINDSEGDSNDEEMIMEMLSKNARTTTSEDRDGGGGLVSTMLDAGVPFPMCRFVSDLLDGRHGGRGRVPLGALLLVPRRRALGPDADGRGPGGVLARLVAGQVEAALRGEAVREGR